MFCFSGEADVMFCVFPTRLQEMLSAAPENQTYGEI